MQGDIFSQLQKFPLHSDVIKQIISILLTRRHQFGKWLHYKLKVIELLQSWKSQGQQKSMA